MHDDDNKNNIDINIIINNDNIKNNVNTIMLNNNYHYYK